MNKKNIQTGIHYPIALPSLEAYKKLDQIASCPVATDIDKSLVSLPVGEHLSSQDTNFVVEEILKL